jgi:hypothetical protein
MLFSKVLITEINGRPDFDAGSPTISRFSPSNVEAARNLDARVQDSLNFSGERRESRKSVEGRAYPYI